MGIESRFGNKPHHSDHLHLTINSGIECYKLPNLQLYQLLPANHYSMFYDELKKRDLFECDQYAWELVDGKPRYRWYKEAQTAIPLIAECEKKHDITHSDFADLEVYFTSMNWVACNDPGALQYILARRSNPVSRSVKEKILQYLEKFQYFEACGLVKLFLATQPMPKERNFRLLLDKALYDIKSLVSHIQSASQILYTLKTLEPHKLDDVMLRDSLAIVLGFDEFHGKRIARIMTALEWLMENAPLELKNQFNMLVCTEIKDEAILLFLKYEKFAICSWLEQALTTYQIPGYYSIPTRKTQNNISTLGEE